MFDDLLRLIEYVPLGPRFNERILNLLLNCLKKNLPGTGKKQVIIATVGLEEDFIRLGMKRHFKYSFDMHPLNEQETASVLGRLGFGQVESQELGGKVKGATVRKLVDATQVVGTNDIEEWLRFWSDLSHSE